MENALEAARLSGGPGDFHVHTVRSSADCAAFLALPRQLRQSDHGWVEPLRFDQRRFFSAEHPFRQRGLSAEMCWYLARDGNGRALGRVAAILNHVHNEHLRVGGGGEAEQQGFFGFFDCAPSRAVAHALLEAAAGWLKERGCRWLVGPASPSHNYEYGLLIEGFAAPHRFLLAHNPPYYQDLLESWGLAKARDLLAFTYDLWDPEVLARFEADAGPLSRIWDRRYGAVRIRGLEMGRWDHEIGLAMQLVNSSLEGNWGYAPLTEAELREMAANLRYALDPELVLFAEQRGQPVGVALALPDLNEVIARLRLRWGYLEPLELLVRARLHRFSAARTIALGVARERGMFGIGPLLLLEVFRRFRRLGLRYMDASWVLEDNEAMLRPIRRFGGVPDRVYRVYSRAL